MVDFGILAVMAIDTVAINSLLSVPKRGGANASILYEMSQDEGDEEYQGDNHEKSQASNPRRVPCVWHKDVQDRKELSQLCHSRTELRRAGQSLYQDVQPFYFANHT
jgi:hypothetical protein